MEEEGGGRGRGRGGGYGRREMLKEGGEEEGGEVRLGGAWRGEVCSNTCVLSIKVAKSLKRRSVWRVEWHFY